MFWYGLQNFLKPILLDIYNLLIFKLSNTFHFRWLNFLNWGLYQFSRWLNTWRLNLYSWLFNLQLFKFILLFLFLLLFLLTFFQMFFEFILFYFFATINTFNAILIILNLSFEGFISCACFLMPYERIRKESSITILTSY